MKLQCECPECDELADFVGLIQVVTDTGYVDQLFACKCGARGIIPTMFSPSAIPHMIIKYGLAQDCIITTSIKKLGIKHG
jgi:predicted NBD/HSP70 family sugar kinase